VRAPPGSPRRPSGVCIAIRRLLSALKGASSGVSMKPGAIASTITP
jgi:hypothetical protein